MHLTNIILLNEANVYNIENVVNGFSVKKYIQQNIAGISDPTIAQQLAKKLQTFLINDERFLHQLTKLPHNAPDWAQQALQRGDLMFFAPTPELGDVMSNIAHYIEAAIENTKSPDNNIVVRAKQELNAIPKIQNLDLLGQKANQYFATASKTTSRDTEGMQPLNEYNGWIWYKLVSEEAFKREGNVLQNCIGKHWTKAKTDSEGNTIYILRSSSDDSVVAIRARGKDIQEIKGKNNKPPVAKYMGYVFNFIKDTTLEVSNSQAKSELKRAGYWVFGNKFIVPLEQAVDMYFDENTKKLHRIEPDDTVEIGGVEMDYYSTPDMVKHILEFTGSDVSHSHVKELYKGSLDNSVPLLFPIRTDNTIGTPVQLSGQNFSGEMKYIVGKFVIEMADAKNYKLGPSLQSTFGITATKPYKLIVDTAKFIGRVADFDKIELEDNIDGFAAWTVAQKYISGATGPRNEFHISTHDYEAETKKGHRFEKTKYIYRNYRAYGGGSTHNMLLFADKNNQVFFISFPYRVSSKDLNPVRRLVSTENLTLAKNASNNKKIVVVPPNTIMTKEEFLTQKISGHTGGVAEVEFENGYKFKKPTGEALTNWLEQTSGSTKTDTVYMLYNQANEPLVAVQVSKNKITGIYANDERPYVIEYNRRNNIKSLPTHKSLDFKYGSYIKALSKKLNLDINVKHLMLSPGKKIADLLLVVVGNPGVLRSVAFKAVHVSPASAPGVDAAYNMLDRPLRQMGLITIGPGSRRGSIALTPTEKGRAVARRLLAGEEIPMLSLTSGGDENIVGGNEPIKPEAPAPRPVRTPTPAAGGEAPVRAARGGEGRQQGRNKAQEIYDLFVQMTNDNNGTMPARGAFIAAIQQPPYNMTPAGASTYAYNVKTKYLQQHGQLGETFTFREWLLAML